MAARTIIFVELLNGLDRCYFPIHAEMDFVSNSGRQPEGIGRFRLLLRVSRRGLFELLERDSIGVTASWAADIVMVALILFQRFECKSDLFLLESKTPIAAVTANLHQFLSFP